MTTITITTDSTEPSNIYRELQYIAKQIDEGYFNGKHNICWKAKENAPETLWDGDMTSLKEEALMIRNKDGILASVKFIKNTTGCGIMKAKKIFDTL